MKNIKKVLIFFIIIFIIAGTGITIYFYEKNKIEKIKITSSTDAHILFEAKGIKNELSEFKKKCDNKNEIWTCKEQQCGDFLCSQTKNINDPEKYLVNCKCMKKLKNAYKKCSDSSECEGRCLMWLDDLKQNNKNVYNKINKIQGEMIQKRIPNNNEPIKEKCNNCTGFCQPYEDPIFNPLSTNSNFSKLIFELKDGFITGLIKIFFDNIISA